MAVAVAAVVWWGGVAGAEEEKPSKPLEASVTAGGSRDTGNTDTLKSRVSAELAHEGKKLTSEFNALYQYEEKDTIPSKKVVELSLKELLRTEGAWAPFVSEKFTWDEIKRVDYDNNIGLGVRYGFGALGGKASVSVSALYQTLKIRDEPEERNAAFALEPRYKWSSGATRFAAGIYYQADADDAKSYKLDSDIKLTYMITNVLGLSAEFESRYRNITSGEGVDKLDTTTSIGVTFVY